MTKIKAKVNHTHVSAPHSDTQPAPIVPITAATRIVLKHQFNTMMLHAEKVANGQKGFSDKLQCDLGLRLGVNETFHFIAALQRNGSDFLVDFKRAIAALDFAVYEHDLYYRMLPNGNLIDVPAPPDITPPEPDFEPATHSSKRNTDVGGFNLFSEHHSDIEPSDDITVEPTVEPPSTIEPPPIIEQPSDIDTHSDSVSPRGTEHATVESHSTDDYSDVEAEPPGLADADLHVVLDKNGNAYIKDDPKSFRAYHDDCVAHFDNDLCRHFLFERGFVDSDFDTLRSFRIGFDPTERRLVIPHSDLDHTARTVADGKPKFKNPAGEKKPIDSLFNASAFNDHDIVLVTEAAIDALSLIVCGVPAVAAHGTGGTVKAVLAAIDIEPKRPRVVLIGFDNDKAGNDAADQLAVELDRRGVLNERCAPPSQFKDFNDALRADRAKLIADITPKLDRARERLDHQKLLTSARLDPIAVLDRVALDVLNAPNSNAANTAAFADHALLAAAIANDECPAEFSVFRNIVKLAGINLKTFDRQISKQLKKPAPKSTETTHPIEDNVLNFSLDTPPIVYVIRERLIKYKKSQAPVSCVKNFDIIFDSDPVLKHILGYNFFAQRIELRRVPAWYSPLQKSFFERAGYQPTLGFTDGDDAIVQNYIDRTYQIRSSEIFQRVVIERSNQDMFHPVQDFLRALPPWDGTKRAERLFIDNLDADDCDYTRAATIHWLVAAVARVFHPACKFDYCLVLQGKQGIGKSTILSMLGGKWFGELDSIAGKDSIENIQGKWIIELTEMQAAKKAENEAIKAFLSRGTDHVRLPYARRSQPFPRQCVLAATTNDSEVLRDQTGGRRFWFIECRARTYSVKLTDEDITQIWAEVFHVYNDWFADSFDSGKLDLPESLKFVAQSLQQSYTDGSDLRGLVEAFLDRPVPRYQFWRLLTKEERRNYFLGNVVYLPYSRIAQSKGTLDGFTLDEVKDNCIELDGDGKKKILMPLDGLGDTNYNDVDRRFIFGDGKRMKVSAVEILNECFDGERSRLVTTRKLADIMRTLDGWQYQRGAVDDPHYGRQNCSFVRVAAEHNSDNSEPKPDNEIEHVDVVDIPF